MNCGGASGLIDKSQRSMVVTSGTIMPARDFWTHWIFSQLDLRRPKIDWDTAAMTRRRNTSSNWSAWRLHTGMTYERAAGSQALYPFIVNMLLTTLCTACTAEAITSSVWWNSRNFCIFFPIFSMGKPSSVIGLRTGSNWASMYIEITLHIYNEFVSDSDKLIPFPRKLGA